MYLTLAAMDIFKRSAEIDRYRENLLKSRAAFCEALAINVVTQYPGEKDHLFQNVLGYKYPELDGEGMMTALEQAISLQALSFLSSPPVEDCVNKISDGQLILEEGHRRPVYQPFRPDEWGMAGLFVGGRRKLNTPRNARFISICTFLLLLCLYTAVVNSRPPGADRLGLTVSLQQYVGKKDGRAQLPANYFSGVEIVMYVLILAFVLDELRQMMYEGFVYYFLSLWNWLDMAWLVIFMSAFTCRCLAVSTQTEAKHGLERQEHWNDMCWDALSLTAVLLWARTLSVISNNQYFGTSILIMTAMLRDALLFVALLVPVLIGVSQAFIGLRPSIPWTQTVFYISTALLGNVNFDDASEYDLMWGPLLYSVWIILGVWVLLNLLIAIFNSSYGNVISRAYHEYRFLKSVEVLESWRNPDKYPFPPPVNLIDLIIVQPVKLLRVSGWERWEKTVWNIATMPFQVLIALWESFESFGARDVEQAHTRRGWMDETVEMVAHQADTLDTDSLEEPKHVLTRTALMSMVEKLSPTASMETKEKLLTELLSNF